MAVRRAHHAESARSWETIGAHLARPGAFLRGTPVFTSLIPVILFIAIGFYVGGAAGYVPSPSRTSRQPRASSVLTPAAAVSLHHEHGAPGRPQLRPCGRIYLVAFGVVYAATLAVQGFKRWAPRGAG